MTAVVLDHATLASMLPDARLAVLRAVDEYFVTSTDDARAGPISAQNEAAALSALLVATAADPALGKLHLEVRAACERLGEQALRDETAVGRPSDSAEDVQLRRWAEKVGVQSSVVAAVFGDGLRGAAAAHDISAGEVVVSVPQAEIITAETAKQSDFGQALQQVPGISEQQLLLLWLMVERHDQESRWGPFWRTLPSLATGLSWEDASLSLLIGTPCFIRFRTAIQHVRAAYEDLQPMAAALLQAYPTILEQRFFDRDAYFWAIQLWYSYTMQAWFYCAHVTFPDGSEHEALVPIASLLNHSAHPHVVQYGCISDSGRLELSTFRSTRTSQQIFLSYGPKTNLELLLFYGFVLSQNPHEEVAVIFQQLPGSAHAAETTAALHRLGISLEHRIRRGRPLPSRMLQCVRLLHTPPAGLQILTAEQLAEEHPAIDRQVYQHIQTALDQLQQELQAAVDRVPSRGGEHAKLIAAYISEQLEIVGIALHACAERLVRIVM